jgi:EspG family
VGFGELLTHCRSVRYRPLKRRRRPRGRIPGGSTSAGPARSREPIAIPKSRNSPDGPRPGERFDFVRPNRYGPSDPTLRPRELMKAARSGVHQLYVTKVGRRSSPLTIVDVREDGRVLTFVSAAAREEPKINFRTGTRENLTDALYGTYTALR